jgi:hypothetical protein
MEDKDIEKIKDFQTQTYSLGMADYMAKMSIAKAIIYLADKLAHAIIYLSNHHKDDYQL